MTINFEQFRKDAKIERVDERITAYTSWYDHCRQYLIEGKMNVLIDASYPLMKPLSDVRIDIILLTHPHCDHSTFAKEMAEYISDFAMKGHKFFNGKIIPVAVSNP